MCLVNFFMRRESPSGLGRQRKPVRVRLAGVVVGSLHGFLAAFSLRFRLRASIQSSLHGVRERANLRVEIWPFPHDPAAPASFGSLVMGLLHRSMVLAAALSRSRTTTRTTATAAEG